MKRLRSIIAVLLLSVSATASAAAPAAEPPTLRAFAKALGLTVKYHRYSSGSDKGKFIAMLRHPTKGVILKHAATPGLMSGASSGVVGSKREALNRLAGEILAHDTLVLAPWDGTADRTRIVHKTPSSFRLLPARSSMK